MRAAMPSPGQGLGGAKAFMQADARADWGDVVVVAGAQHLGAADPEGLPRRVRAGQAPQVVRR
jgi:hypothetical protein